MITISKVCIFILSFVLVSSIFIANILSSVSLDDNFLTDNIFKGRNYTSYLAKKYGKITDTDENLLWFLQISDIHISIFKDPKRINEFKEFCDETVRLVKPTVVLASGDLTDAKTKDNMGSSQFTEEWEIYFNIIKDSHVTKETQWLDIRGNHDIFDVKNINSYNNFFRNYSVQGLKNPRSYFKTFEVNNVKVAFLGVDACPQPGLKRPFNFIGYLTKDDQDKLIKLEKEASSQVDHIIWFGHYPSSTILWSNKGITKHKDIRDLISHSQSSLTYLCGHLHTMGGVAENMYSMQKEGYLELELSDWKDNREYRLGALDHGLFSFVDQKNNDWPLVLVTNPKSSNYHIPGREPIELIQTSTHIRILAFSKIGIKVIKVRIDKGVWEDCDVVDGPLYACKWNSQLYKIGQHNMEVSVTEMNGNEKIINHVFSIESSLVPYQFQSRVFLMSDALNVFQGVFATFLVLSVVPLCLLRLKTKAPSFSYFRNFTTRLWLLSKIDKLFYPLIFYSVYLPFGPWIIGELIEGEIGAIFAWGIFIDNTFLPGVFTYVYGSIQLMFIHIPLILILASCVERRMQEKRYSLVGRVWNNLPFIIVLSFQLLLAYFFWLAYGAMAFLFGPLRTWSIALNLYLWFTSVTLSQEYIRKLRSLYRVSLH